MRPCWGRGGSGSGPLGARGPEFVPLKGVDGLACKVGGNSSVLVVGLVASATPAMTRMDWPSGVLLLLPVVWLVIWASAAAVLWRRHEQRCPSYSPAELAELHA